MGTRGAWGRALLAALGNSSPTPQTINFVAAWTVAEGTRARYNPLATTHPRGNSTRFNSVGVQNFVTREDGIAATVETLNGRYPGYEDIREGLRTNDPERALRGLMIAPWGTNGALVAATWRTRDATAELLLSENGADPPGHQEPQPPGPGGRPRASDAPPDERPADDRQYMTASIPYLRRVGKIAGGAFIVLAAGLLAIRTFVPVRQVIEVAEGIGKVAAV